MSTSVAAPPAAGAAVLRFERRAMGSPLRLTVVGADAGRAAAAWAAVSALAEEVEQALSRFRETSDLVTLNRRAGDRGCAPVHARLYAAVAAAERAWRLTGGAFDPRVLGDLERLGYRGDGGGHGAALRGAGPAGRAAAFADGRWLRREPRERSLAIAAPIDLGGIGKGLALRWASGALARTLPGFGDRVGALLEAGGDLVVAGPAPQPGPWLVGVEMPGTSEEAAVLAVEAGAVCTSSTAVHAWTDAEGRPVHHLVDPRTGEPGGAGLRAVTVAGPDPAWAEVWSKALFLEGAGRIGSRARSLGVAAWWVLEDGALEMTPAARHRTVWAAGEA